MRGKRLLIRLDPEPATVFSGIDEALQHRAKVSGMSIEMVHPGIETSRLRFSSQVAVVHRVRTQRHSKRIQWQLSFDRISSGIQGSRRIRGSSRGSLPDGC
jgi:hypothetical protein